MALTVISSTPSPAPSIRVALVRTTASCPDVYNEFRRALIGLDLEVSEAGIGSVSEGHRASLASSGGAGWVFVVCRMASNDMVTTRLIQEQLVAAGLSRGDCVVLTPVEGRGKAQATAVARKVEMNLRLLDSPVAPGKADGRADRRTTCADSDIRTQVVRAVRLVDDEEGSRSETEMTMPYAVVPNVPTEVYQRVQHPKPGKQRQSQPPGRLSAPASIGAAVVERGPRRGLRALVAVAAVGCLAGAVAWQWDAIVGQFEGSRAPHASAEGNDGEQGPTPTGPLAHDEQRSVAPPAADVVQTEEETAQEVVELAAGRQRSAGPDDEAERVAAALEARTIRALDSVLVDTKRSRRIGFEQARDRCDERNVDGVGGWRLPEIGELRSLSKRKMIPKARYWTSNEADLAGSRHVVWDAVNKDIVISRHDSKRVRSVCVRDHVGHRS